MKPYYEQGGITVYHGKCEEVLLQITSESVDLVLTSPPYNIGNDQHTGNMRHKAYDDNLPELDYQSLQVSILNQLYRVVNEKGSLLYNHKNRIRDGITITPYVWLLQTQWLLKQELVWFNRSQNFDKCRFYPMTERIYWLAKSPSTQLVNVINRHDVFDWATVGTGGKHTRAFPLVMARDLMACFPDAQVVLDPYMGSGTTLRAAKDLGKCAIGIESKKAYCDLAIDRLSQEVLPLEETA